MSFTRLITLCTLLAAVVVAAGCASVGPLSLKTEVQGTWKDPKYALAPLTKIFIISLMKVEPGGRDAVENAIVAQLQGAGVTGVASHTLMSSDPLRPGPSLAEAIKASGAEAVLLVEVRAVGVYEPYTVGQTMTSITPDTMAFYNYLKQENVYQPGDYKVARIASELYLPTMGKQLWTAFTNSFDAANLARNLPDFTLKLVGAMSKDHIIAGARKPVS